MRNIQGLEKSKIQVWCKEGVNSMLMHRPNITKKDIAEWYFWLMKMYTHGIIKMTDNIQGEVIKKSEAEMEVIQKDIDKKFEDGKLF